jgi:proteasome lid subunit RPN8/RPN11
VQESLDKLLPEIYSHMEKEAPHEGCGLIVQKNDKIKFISVENKSENKNSFYIDPKEYIRHSMISKILYIVHSHYNEDCRPSEHDKNTSKVLGIPYLIVSLPERGEYIYDPS